MRKCVSLLFVGLILTVFPVCERFSIASESSRDMILIPAGEFIMGTDFEGTNADQKPAHPVYLDAFYIDKHEVTNAQFEAFIVDGGYQNRKLWTAAGWNFIQKHQIKTPLHHGQNSISIEPDHPVIGVSWYEANAYAAWVGKRLPTEAEWEKAARGIDGRTYPWGNEIDFSRLNYFSHHEKILRVGSFLSGASPYGVLDMAGSVWEWCADWYGESRYSQSPQKNPTGPNKGQYRVLRGGGWNSIRLQLRCSYRHYDREDRRAYNIGFRCAQDATEQ